MNAAGVNLLNGMDFIVLPDDDEKLKDLEPGCIGCDGCRFYVPESKWAKLKNQLTLTARVHQQE